ncbi:hypothetical protein [Actinomadura sp. SCN-SB]|uniref:hypothetical protein n=1 Tax=Actinomadura sp. SCN-SB TaxID=3373092 RepID=UPI003752A708
MGAGGLVLALAAWRPLVRRAGWAPWPTLALTVWVALVVSVTSPRSADPGAAARLGACVSDPVADIAWSIAIFGTRGMEDVMNVGLWVPCGLLGVLATRRAVAAPALIAAGFVVVELSQSLDAGRWWWPPGRWPRWCRGGGAHRVISAEMGTVTRRSGDPYRRAARDQRPVLSSVTVREGHTTIHRPHRSAGAAARA